MSTGLETTAELLKLRRLLRLGPEDLDFLAEVPAEDLRSLRESATDLLFDTGARTMARLGKASALLPSPVVATIAERAFGPLLCARAAGTVEPAKAIDVAKRLPADFLTDVTVELDPRRVAAIISQVPERLVVPVADELGRRGEYVTMGRFLAYVSDGSIAAAMGALSDEALLRTAFVLEHKDALDHAVGVLPPERLPGIIGCASTHGLWAEALDLLDHLSDARRGPVADVVADQDEEVVADLVGTVSARGLWPALLPVLGTMSPEGRLRIASRPSFHERGVLGEILLAAGEQRAWSDLVPLLTALPLEVRRTAVELLVDLDPDRIEDLLAAVGELGLWPEVLGLVRLMDERTRLRFAAMPAFHRAEIVGAIVESAAAASLWIDLVPLVRALPEPAVALLPPAVARLERTVLAAMLAEATATVDTLLPMLDVLAALDRSGTAAVVAVIDEADRELAVLLLAALVDPVPGDPVPGDSVPGDPLLVAEVLSRLPQPILNALEAAADRFDLGAEYTAARAGRPPGS